MEYFDYILFGIVLFFLYIIIYLLKIIYQVQSTHYIVDIAYSPHSLTTRKAARHFLTRFKETKNTTTNNDEKEALCYLKGRYKFVNLLLKRKIMNQSIVIDILGEKVYNEFNLISSLDIE